MSMWQQQTLIFIGIATTFLNHVNGQPTRPDDSISNEQLTTLFAHFERMSAFSSPIELISDGEEVEMEDPVYNNQMYEGDIATPGLNAHNVAQFVQGTPIYVPPSAEQGSRRHYTAVPNKYELWPKALIPYKVSREFTSDQLYVLYSAIREIEKVSCVRFVAASYTDRDFVFVFPENGCWSSVGRQRGRQELSLGAGCVRKGVIMHELMHVLGFFHEQSRYDRDSYVDIIWNNIWEDSKDQFHKFEEHEADTLYTPYDYDSITHYGPRAFSHNLQPTITTKKPGVRIGQRSHLSVIDIERIGKLYQCNDRSPTSNRGQPHQTFTLRPIEPQIRSQSESCLFCNRATPSLPRRPLAVTRRPTRPSRPFTSRRRITTTSQPTTSNTWFTSRVRVDKRNQHQGLCKDKIANCNYISAQKTICSTPMLSPLCPLTCKLCDPKDDVRNEVASRVRLTTVRPATRASGSERGCVNKESDTKCNVLKDKGYCDTAYSVTGRYLRLFCRKTCGFC